MAGPVYSNLVMSLMRGSNDLLDVQPEAYITELPIHNISFRLMGWFSMVCGALLFVEQYFFRRASCFQPESYSQPQAAISEYCWEHGEFQNNRTSLLQQTGVLDYVSSLTHKWMLQAYAYFMIRFFVFAMPHILWGLKYKAYIQSIIKSSVDVLKELETLWIQHGEKAENAYRERLAKPDDCVAKFKQLKFKFDLVTSLRAIKAMTRDIIQITRHQVPHYTPVLNIIQMRMVYDILFLSVFVVLDFFLFLLCSHYDSTDFHCHLPSKEVIRCMTPMMQLLWQLVLLSLLASCFTLLMNSAYFITVVHDILSPNTKHCFLSHIPYSQLCEDITFTKVSDRKVYKLLSRFLMHNYVVMQPLNFLESFVQHLEDNRQVHVEVLKQALGYGAEEAMEADRTEKEEEASQAKAWDKLLSTDI